MERWSKTKNDYTENPKIDKFLDAIILTCKRHGFSISHEDGHGAFIIERYQDNYSKWIHHAMDNTEKK